LLRALFPAATFGPLAHAVADACRLDGIARIASLLGLTSLEDTDGAPSAALARVGSGAVEAVLHAPLGERLLLGPEAAARWRRSAHDQAPPVREPLASATAALASRSLAVQVELEGCELEVGVLRDLQVGDVVRLEHGLQSPATLRHAGAPLCRGYLGRQGNLKAVELAGRVHPAAGEVPR
jgi:hypothetical protein